MKVKTKLLPAIYLAVLMVVAACGGGGGGGTAGGGGSVAVPAAPLTGHSVQLIVTAATPPAGASVPLPQTTIFTYNSATTWSATISAGGFSGSGSGTYTYVKTSATTATYHFDQTVPGTATGDVTFTAASATDGTFTGTLSAPGISPFPVSGTYTVLY